MGEQPPTANAPSVPTPFVVANEFAAVRVGVVHTRNGVRLRVESARDGATVDLCPLELESLATIGAEARAELVRCAIDGQGRGAADVAAG